MGNKCRYQFAGSAVLERLKLAFFYRIVFAGRVSIASGRSEKLLSVDKENIKNMEYALILRTLLTLDDR